MAREVSSSDSQVDDIQMFKVNIIIYHCYAHIRIKLQGVGMEADMGHFIYCILLNRGKYEETDTEKSYMVKLHFVCISN